MLNGACSERAMLALSTDASGSGYGRLWPTPTARDHKDTGENTNYEKIAKKHRLSGVVQVKKEEFWTPTACEGNNSGRLDEWGGSGNRFRGTKEGSGQLSPPWVEWLMGWPSPGWTDLEPLDPEIVRDWLDQTRASTYWSADPADREIDPIPRIASGVPKRRERLSAIGNGQVPLCAATAWEILT